MRAIPVLHCASHELPMPCATCRAESTPDIPEEAVEAVARARWVVSFPDDPWPGVQTDMREARLDLEAAAPALRKQGAEEYENDLIAEREAVEAERDQALAKGAKEERERLRTQLSMLAMMLRENQRHEEGDRNYYDEKGEQTHPRRLMHDGKASAYRHAGANLAPILAALDTPAPSEPEGSDVDLRRLQLGKKVRLSLSFGGGVGEIVGEFDHSAWPVKLENGEVVSVSPFCLEPVESRR